MPESPAHPTRLYRLARRIVPLLCLLLVPASAVLAHPLGQAAAPARCHWIGTATKPADRLSATQFVVTMDVDRVVDSDAAPPADPVAVIVNSTYGASFYRPFDVKTGTALDVSGYIRAGGQCVVDTLNVGTLFPGYEGYLRPAAACPTAGDEVISVVERATVSLGCAVSPMFTAPTAVQHFQAGLMVNLKGIYVLQDGPAAIDGKAIEGGSWSGTRNTWREGEPTSGNLTPPSPDLQEPLLGFGKAWREQLDGPDGPLGWATGGEKTTDASWQLFEKGIVVVTRPGEGLIMYHEGRVWEWRQR